MSRHRPRRFKPASRSRYGGPVQLGTGRRPSTPTGRTGWWVWTLINNKRPTGAAGCEVQPVEGRAWAWNPHRSIDDPGVVPAATWLLEQRLVREFGPGTGPNISQDGRRDVRGLRGENSCKFAPPRTSTCSTIRSGSPARPLAEHRGFRDGPLLLRQAVLSPPAFTAASWCIRTSR